MLSYFMKLQTSRLPFVNFVSFVMVVTKLAYMSPKWTVSAALFTPMCWKGLYRPINMFMMSQIILCGSIVNFVNENYVFDIMSQIYQLSHF